MRKTAPVSDRSPVEVVEPSFPVAKKKSSTWKTRALIAVFCFLYVAALSALSTKVAPVDNPTVSLETAKPRRNPIVRALQAIRNRRTNEALSMIQG